MSASRPSGAARAFSHSFPVIRIQNSVARNSATREFTGTLDHGSWTGLGKVGDTGYNERTFWNCRLVSFGEADIGVRLALIE